MEDNVIVIHFGELWLKGRNRHVFVSTLFKNIENAINGQEYGRLNRERDRFVIYLNAESKINNITDSLRYIPGISYFSPAKMIKADINEILAEGAAILSNAKNPIKIVVHRSYKNHKFTSWDIVHAFITSKKTNPHIDKNSKKILYINVAKDNAFLYTKKMEGAGGLPVGASGKAVILLSGGIDSPVASFLAMKRGIEPIYLHFYAFQDYKKVAESKIPRIANKLLKYSNTAKVYYAPAHLFQIATMKIPIKYELVLFKRFMYKYAEAVAKKEDAKAIVTGESVGQVASQTIDNMQATQHGIKTLILRPLTGMDKIEIIRKAEELDTFKLSIEAYRDVCSIKIKNPKTKADSKSIDKFYRSCRLSEVLRKTMKMSFVETLKINEGMKRN